jgi:hypothetical protein
MLLKFLVKKAVVNLSYFNIKIKEVHSIKQIKNNLFLARS